MHIQSLDAYPIYVVRIEIGAYVTEKSPSTGRITGLDTARFPFTQ